MSGTVKKLYSGSPSISTNFYTVPAGKVVIIEDFVLRGSGSSASQNVQITLNGTAFQFSGFTDAANGIQLSTLKGAVLHAGETIGIFNQSVAMTWYAHVSGVELDAASIAKPKRLYQGTPSSAITLYTAPANRRVIVKKVVGWATGGVNTITFGVTGNANPNFALTSGQNANATVLENLILEAGESLTINSMNATVVNLYISGVEFSNS